MSAHDLEACLLFSEPNTRYATGATAMPIWSMSTFTRCAVVPVEGTPILFEHPNSVHRSRLRARRRAADARVGVLRRPRRAGARVRRRGGRGAPGARRARRSRRGRPARHAGLPCAAGLGLELVDSAPATQEAREVKTSQEVAAVPRERRDRVGDARPSSRRRSLPGSPSASCSRCWRRACSAAAPSTWRRTRCAPVRTRTPGAPRRPTARWSPATSSTSTPTRSASKGSSSACRARS